MDKSFWTISHELSVELKNFFFHFGLILEFEIWLTFLMKFISWINSKCRLISRFSLQSETDVVWQYRKAKQIVWACNETITFVFRPLQQKNKKVLEKVKRHNMFCIFVSKSFFRWKTFVRKYFQSFLDFTWNFIVSYTMYRSK